jgi:GDPmannose 4,6-dehydratase
VKKAIISGITGQDGSYLAELLLKKGYEVYGFVRPETYDVIGELFSDNPQLLSRVNFVSVSIVDSLAVYGEVHKIGPDEFYHLAAHSFVSYDMKNEIHIMDVNFNSTLYIVSALKDLPRPCKLFFAGSSEMFGNPDITPQNEDTRFNPKSVYGIAKLASYYLLRNFREKEGLFAVTGIMFNHESPRRASKFVTKKIVTEAVKIKYGLSDSLELGNLDAKRDWGYAPDYAYSMWLMLQQETPEDYVVATGTTRTVREFVSLVFDYLGMNYKSYVRVNEAFFRPSEAVPLCGDSSKIRGVGWSETKDFEDVVKELIEFEERKYQG